MFLWLPSPGAVPGLWIQATQKKCEGRRKGAWGIVLGWGRDPRLRLAMGWKSRAECRASEEDWWEWHCRICSLHLRESFPVDGSLPALCHPSYLHSLFCATQGTNGPWTAQEILQKHEAQIAATRLEKMEHFSQWFCSRWNPLPHKASSCSCFSAKYRKERCSRAYF